MRTVSRQAICVPCEDFEIQKKEQPIGYAMDVFEEHPAYEIYYQLSGAMLCQCDEVGYVLRAGSALLLGENCPHKARALDGGPSRGLGLRFAGSYLEELGLAFPDVDFAGFLNRRRCLHLDRLSWQEQQTLEGTLRQLLSLQEGKDTRGEAACKLLLGALLLFLQPLCGGVTPPDGARENAAGKLTTQVQSYLAERYAQPITLQEVAALFQVSAPYLSRSFHKGAGMSFVEYLNTLRVQAAQDLLQDPTVPVEDIGKRCGFGTPAHFRRVFKAAVGVSPSQFRKRALTREQKKSSAGNAED